MFSSVANEPESKNEIETTIKPVENVAKYNKYNTVLKQAPKSHNTSKDNIDKLLENEKIKNKTESWNKLEKSTKIQLLHTFAEKYGRENSISVKDIKSLKMFFTDCIEKGKLGKSKDVIYNKDLQEISSIPSLFFNPTNKNFTLKINDKKHVSTLKSLTPKRPVAIVNATLPSTSSSLSPSSI